MDKTTLALLNQKVKKKNITFIRQGEKTKQGILMKIEGEFCLIKTTETDGEWVHYSFVGFKAKFKEKE
ncbi:MAG: hypothetical protein B6I31_01435 [Desulfobacteraceae bacterium 4572_19]|nr:MAG: hypothetical protein B6I31_01435 [Desulfobacteraceae bacterium 4572_19]